MEKYLILLSFLLISSSCSDNKIDKKGFQVNEITEDDSERKVIGIQIDSLKLETRPRNVLLTFNTEHRLILIYKVV